MRLSDAIDQVYASRDINIDTLDVKGGRLFLRRLTRHLPILERLKEEHMLSTDKKGYLTTDLFPITVEIINREQAPGREVYIKGGLMGACIVYYGLSPELENFVAIVLWPDESKTSKLAYRRIYQLVTEDEKRERVVRFHKGYGLELPNLVHPWVDRDIDTIPKPKKVYDWRFAPYLKEIGESILSHKSPLNFRKVFSQDVRRLPVYINLKSAVGKLNTVRKDQISILVLSFRGRDKNFVANVSKQMFNSLREFPKGSIVHVLVSETCDDNVIREINCITPASPIDMLASMLSFLLYTMYVGTRRLKLMSIQNFNFLFQGCAKKIVRFCALNSSSYRLWTPENVFSAYLKPFFRIENDYVYYVPFFLSDASEEIIEMFDEALAQRRKGLFQERGLVFDRQGRRMDTRKLGMAYRILRFLLDSKRFLWWSQSHRFILANVLAEKMRSKWLARANVS